MNTTKKPRISRDEFNRIMVGLKRRGWEHTLSVMDDCDTGGLRFEKNGNVFWWNHTTDAEARTLATPLTPAAVRTAAYAAWERLDRSHTLDAGVKRAMCDTLRCDPHELDAVLTDEVIESILC